LCVHVVGCEYGDHSDWCNMVDSFQCYRHPDTCCNTCKHFYTAVAGISTPLLFAFSLQGAAENVRTPTKRCTFCLNAKIVLFQRRFGCPFGSATLGNVHEHGMRSFLCLFFFFSYFILSLMLSRPNITFCDFCCFRHVTTVIYSL